MNYITDSNLNNKEISKILKEYIEGENPDRLY